jgi:hypothetical protein
MIIIKINQISNLIQEINLIFNNFYSYHYNIILEKKLMNPKIDNIYKIIINTINYKYR